MKNIKTYNQLFENNISIKDIIYNNEKISPISSDKVMHSDDFKKLNDIVNVNNFYIIKKEGWYFVPAIIAPKSREITSLSFKNSGTFPRAIL